MSRLYKYQLRHIEKRLRAIADDKIAEAVAKQDEEVSKLRDATDAVTRPTQEAAIDTFVEIASKLSKTQLKHLVKKHTSHQPYIGSISLELTTATGLRTKAERVRTANAKKVDQVRKRLYKRRRAINDEVDRVMDGLYLGADIGQIGIDRIFKKFEQF